MRKFGFTLAIATLTATLLTAQQPAPAPGGGRGPGAQPAKDYLSAADVAALIAEAKAEHKDGQALQNKRMVSVPPLNASLEYRTGITGASVHETEAELMYVIDGSGTIVTGGKLTEEKRQNPTNLSGTAVEGGTSRHVGKGDFIMISEGTPHWWSSVDGTVVLMTLHIPHTTEKK